MSRAEWDHSIVAATIRLCGRFAPNRPKRPVNRQKLGNNDDTRRDLARAIDRGLRELPVLPTDYLEGSEDSHEAAPPPTVNTDVRIVRG